MTKSAHRRGMTMVEMLMAVVIIVMLAAFLIPVINLTVRSRENAECAYKLRTAVEAFELYAAETGGYPEDKNPGVVPPEMAAYYFPYFKIDWWGEVTDLGGRWDWDKDYNFKYSVSISSPNKSVQQMTELDQSIDDGNLSSGRFRQVGSQYHYIIEQ